MDSASKENRSESASPGYGYAVPGYGYGYGAGENAAHQRAFRDYLLILRERIWYIIVVFFVTFSSVLVYTFNQTKEYESTATIQIFRRDPNIMQVQAVMDNEVRSAEDLNTQIKVLESAAIAQRVAERLTGNDLRQFLAPYEKTAAGEVLTPVAVLLDNRRIVPQRLSLFVFVQYRHPDRQIAAKVANLFVDEFITYNARVRIEESMKAVEDLKVRAEQQRKKVAELAGALQNYREKRNMVSLDQRKDIVTEKLKTLSIYLTQATARVKDAEVRLNQVKERLAQGRDLLDLPFIANQPIISQLMQRVASQNIVIAELSNHYRAKHPRMIEAENSLKQTQDELKRAVAQAAAAVDSEYQTNLQSEKEARAQLAAQEAESLELDRYSVEYSNLDRELKVNEEIFQSTMGRMRETSMSSTLETQNARVVDRAAPADLPASPKIVLNLALGAVGGIALGLTFAFLVAFIDDRVKSSFDIESVIGLPIVGIIPELRNLSAVEKAQVVFNQADRSVSEAFLSLHSSLRLKDESKNAKCVLITSTIPGEGKSFLSTNLALTFAAHGERTVIVDCDLRKPNVHKSLQLENTRGLIDVVTGTVPLDEALVRGVHPNLDVLPAGGRAKNPTQILNSKNFDAMLAELRQRYDRVFLDTPPLAAVSDALVILPLVDGSLFTIFFNKVRRKSAQFCAKRLLETNVPCFGAVLNGLNLAISGYYYAQYYDRSYKDYYVVMAKEEGGKS